MKTLITTIIILWICHLQRDNYVGSASRSGGHTILSAKLLRLYLQGERPCSLFSARYVFWVRRRTSIVAEYRDHTLIDEKQLEPGDIADFDGVHVAAYIGGGVSMDSDIAHGGVGPINLWMKPLSDPWFAGGVRILRWN